MDDLGFIVGSYVVTFGSIVSYVVSVVRRSRRAGPTAGLRRGRGASTPAA